MTYDCDMRADLGFFNSCWWDVDLGEGVHGSLHRVALDSWHRVEDLLCQSGLVSQGVQDCVLLLHKSHNT